MLEYIGQKLRKTILGIKGYVKNSDFSFSYDLRRSSISIDSFQWADYEYIKGFNQLPIILRLEG